MTEYGGLPMSNTPVKKPRKTESAKLRSIEITLLKILDELSSISRKQKELDSQVTLIYEDHNLLETIQSNVTGLHERVNSNFDHYERVVKDLRGDILEEVFKTQANVQKTTEKTLEHVTEQTAGITTALEKENIISKKENILKKLMKRKK